MPTYLVDGTVFKWRSDLSGPETRPESLTYASLPTFARIILSCFTDSRMSYNAQAGGRFLGTYQGEPMKKTTVKKLVLAKETVRSLELSRDQQGEIYGGVLPSYSCKVFECPVNWV